MRTNDELIRAVHTGEKDAFAELVRRYERAVWATAWRTLRDHHATQDATQNAFVEAYRQLGQLRDPACFGVWLLKIAKRETLRVARRRETDRPSEKLADVADESQLPPGDEAGEIIAAVGSLPEHERLVVALRFFDGHPVAEVARLTGRPIGTVTKQLSRALERLRSILSEVNT